MEADFTFLDVKRERMQDSWPIAGGLGPCSGITLNLFSFSGLHEDSQRSVLWNLNELSFIWSLVDKVKESWAKLKQSFPGDIHDWEERAALPTIFSSSQLLLITGEVFWIDGLCHLGTPYHKVKFHQPTTRDGRQEPTCKPHFKMHFEVWANNVNDIQWGCQMLVIYSHFHINMDPPVMNWKLNKHISFN